MVVRFRYLTSRKRQTSIMYDPENTILHNVHSYTVIAFAKEVMFLPLCVCL